MDFYSSRLASPWRRLAASLLDLLLLAAPLGLLLAADYGVFGEPTSEWMSLTALGLIATVGLGELFFLRADRQTLGKKWLGLRIEVDRDQVLTNDDVPGPFHAGDEGIEAPELLRYVPFFITGLFGTWVPWLVPVLWLLVVAPMFGAARRGLHDYIGNSNVVTVDDQ